MKKNLAASLLGIALLAPVGAYAIDYPPPEPLNPAAQASFDNITAKPGAKLRVAYMPPTTVSNYYVAIGEGIKAVAAQNGVETFMLAPESDADVDRQIGMLQDVIGQNVDAIIFGTHDEGAAAQLVKRAVDKGIIMMNINSDIADFPTPIHADVGYAQRKGTVKMGEYALKLAGGKAMNVGIIEGLPGYHSTERVGGFLDAIKGSSLNVVASVSGKWNVQDGNAAAMDMLQAHPEINMIFAANDYMAMGAEQAAKSLGRSDIILLGNDGDTAALEEVAGGGVTATVNTTPFVMGQIAMQALLDGVNGKFKGGFVETPTTIVDKDNVLPFLKDAATLYPKPSKAY